MASRRDETHDRPVCVADSGHDLAASAVSLDAGRAAQLLLSHDICSRLQLRHYGGPGFDYVPTTVVGRLREAGVSNEDLEQMLIANPRRLLSMPA